MIQRFAWRTSALFTLPALLLATACQPADDEAADGDMDAMAQVASSPSDLTAEYESHYNMHHADVIAGYWTEDALASYADGSIVRGREGIEAYHAAQFANNPTAEIEVVDEMTMGDQAVAIGTWSVDAAPEGAEPMQMSGSWMAGYVLVDGEWKVKRLVTNYDREMSAEYLSGEAGDPPAEQSTMGEVLQAYEAAWAAGDVDAIMGTYADDAWASHANLPPVTDAANHRTVMSERVAGTIEIHGVETWDLGDGWVADGGWYVLTPPDGEPMRGNYAYVAHTEDGETEIKWLISNGRPVSMIPTDDAM